MTSIHESIQLLLHDFRSQTGKKPGGIVLGPMEYLQLCEYVTRSQPHLQDAMVQDILVTQYGEYPIFVKEMPGVDLLIPYADAVRYIK